MQLDALLTGNDQNDVFHNSLQSHILHLKSCILLEQEIQVLNQSSAYDLILRHAVAVMHSGQ